jgi:hypothetical protein
MPLIGGLEKPTALGMTGAGLPNAVADFNWNGRQSRWSRSTSASRAAKSAQLAPVWVKPAYSYIVTADHRTHRTEASEARILELGVRPVLSTKENCRTKAQPVLLERYNVGGDRYIPL